MCAIARAIAVMKDLRTAANKAIRSAARSRSKVKHLKVPGFDCNIARARRHRDSITASIRRLQAAQ
jgi:hypothetical protein